MKVVTIAAFLQLLRVTVSGQSVNKTVYGSLGEDLLLQCHGSDGSPVYTRWTKDGQEIMKRDHSATAASLLDSLLALAGQHHTIMGNGTLCIRALTVADEGTYLCNSSFNNSTTTTAQTRLQLKVVSGPLNISASIGPATALTNGTLFVKRGATVSFSCSAMSYPSQILSWSFKGGNDSSNDSLTTGPGSSLDFRIEDIQPGAQGEYSCTAQNSLSQRNTTWSAQLLVYYVPERHPECLWKLGEDPVHVHFICSWLGAYPTPTLYWGENHLEPGHHLHGHLFASEQNDSVALVLNRTLLFDGMALRCKAEHPVLNLEDEKNSCLFVLEPPFPDGEPLATALEGTDKTLTCTEGHSLPPANTTWMRTAQQEAIVAGSKYILSVEGPALKLTILNVSKEDQGLYFCRSENLLGVRELEVYLTVKTSAPYSGAIIGIFLAALIVGSGIIIAKTLYSSRDRICLGSIFGQVEDDRGDVLSLVESDEEEIFQDTVPRLPPLSLTNGNHTTLVQIHRIPSSENEDTEVAETSLQRQEDTVRTEEATDLVTF